MSKTYRILIVEDEAIESSALVVMLKYNRQDVGEIQTAANGVEALALYGTFQPDIVLMDINLPGINGLDVIRQMRMMGGSASFVIISAHSQFSYAQEAMRLDVMDFLVKPIRLEDINRVLDEVIADIEHSRSREETVRRQETKLEAIRPVLESDCVLSIASMRSNAPVATIFDFMQIPVTSGFVFAVRGKENSGTLLREIKMRLRNMGLRCIGEIINEICVCVALSGETIRQTQIEETISYLSGSLSSAGYDCQIGVGSVANCADDLRHSYEQAMAATRKAAEAGMNLSFEGGSREGGGRNNLAGISDWLVRICQSIRMGRAKEMADKLQSFFGAIQLCTDYRQIQEAAYSLYIMVFGSFPDKAQQVRPITASQIFATQDINILRHTLTEAFIQLMDAQKEDGGNQSNQIVQGAIQLVKKNFQKDITLDSVAEELSISSFYLSKLFHKHTGKNFTEFLTQQRIQHAKSLLDQGEMNIKEVAYAAGFNSQSYFSKIFKKYVGVAPSEYKGPSEQ